MSKIAQQKALEAISDYDYDDDYDEVVDKRNGYIQGYDQAMQDFMEKAEEAISQISRHFIGENYTFEQVWECFKNYMQDEM